MASGKRRSALYGRNRSEARRARTEGERRKARKAGFETPYQERQARLALLGFGPGAAAGKARPGEVRVSQTSRSHRSRRRAALHAIADERREPWLTPDQAAGKHGLKAEEVRRLVPGAFTATGDLKPYDNATRRITIISNGAVEQVTVHSSRVASLAGEYMAAVRYALATGDDTQLRTFAGKRVAGYELEADLDVLQDMAESAHLDGVEFYWELAA